jgi:hypothetical protein
MASFRKKERAVCAPITLFFAAYCLLSSYAQLPREIKFVWRTSFFVDGLHVLQITFVLGDKLEMGLFGAFRILPAVEV